MKYLGDDMYQFDSGDKFYANCGIIGLSPKECHEKDEWYISGGYDQGIYESRDWSKEQRKEVAEYMINKWKEWSEQ